jgi:hypothetical protein
MNASSLDRTTTLRVSEAPAAAGVASDGGSGALRSAGVSRALDGGGAGGASGE